VGAQIVVLVLELTVAHDFCNEPLGVVLLNVFEQHPICRCRSCEQLDCPRWQRINGTWVVVAVFVSVSVDLRDVWGGSRSMLLREPSNLSSWEESDPVSGLVVPILNGDNKVGGAVVCIEDESIWSLLCLHLEALLHQYSYKFLFSSCAILHKP
jgi:hypothetical protein